MVDAAFRVRIQASRKTVQVELDPKIHEERLRIAERIVQALREARYSCELAENGPARALIHEH